MSENAEVGAVEDEIEVWTTDEDRPVRDVPPSIGSCSTSSNSKFSLLNRGVLTQSTVKANTSKFTDTWFKIFGRKLYKETTSYDNNKPN
ncbi:unnamed protein product [Urochloa humidicola]